MNRAMIKVALVATTALSVVTPALAQDAGDIVVTARRVEERLQDVPISITVYNQEQLSNRNVMNAADLAATTPSLQVNSNFGSENSTFSIRGFVQDIGTAPTVGVYFGDVVAPRGGAVGIPSGDGAGPGSLFDLQNVQVLKGPQGTLQGRNTTGGSVMLVPRKPTSQLEGYVEGGIGNYDLRGVQAVLNVPFGDTFRMRLGVDRQSRDGYMKNKSGIGPKDFNDLNYTAVRASFVVDLTPDLENYTIASFSNSNTHGSVGKLYGAYPAGTLGGFAYDQLQEQHDLGLGYYDVMQDMPDARNKTKQWQVINTTTWHASDTLTIKNIASYAEYKQWANLPIFGTSLRTTPENLLQYLNANTIMATPFGPAPVSLTGLSLTDILGGADPSYALALTGALSGLGGSPLQYAVTHTAPGVPMASQSTFTEELQFQGHSTDNRLTWQAGAYFESSKPLGLSGVQTPTMTYCSDLESTSVPNPTCNNTLIQATGALDAIIAMAGADLVSAYGANPFIISPATSVHLTYLGGTNRQVTRTKLTDVGLYAQASYELTSKLKATGGFRYTWDKHKAVGQMYFSSLTGYTFCIADLAIMGLNGEDCSVAMKKKSQKPTWLLGLDYKPTNDLLLYAKYARGYRTGGVKPDAPAVVNTFEPEKVDNFEVGFKSSFRGAISGIFNADVFYNKFNNQQVQLGIQSLIGLPGGATPMNVGKSRLWGIEADTTLNLFKGFTLNAGYTYLNTKVQKIAPFVGCSSLMGYQLLCIGSTPAALAIFTSEEGKPLTYSPKNKYSVTGTYVLPLPESVGKIALSATFTHTDKQRSTYSYDTFLAHGSQYYIDTPTGLALSSKNLGILPATNLLDVAVNWKSVAGAPLDLTLFATNVTKEKYISAVQGLIPFGLETTPLGAPRMYGMRAKVNF